jgi:hypothetical protein
MPLPTNFSPWEHFQQVLIQVQNRKVRTEFSDLDDDDDITVARSSLRVACTLRDDDSAIFTLLRLFFFYGILRGWRDFWPTIYASSSVPSATKRRHKPQITLYFSQDLNDIEPGYDPVAGEISFRIMNEETSTFTTAKLETLANKVKSLFSTGGGFVWHKGKTLYSYSDWDRGYQLQLLCISEAEAKRIVEQVLDVQNHTPDWSNFNTIANDQPAEAYPNNPGTKNILGKQIKVPRRRPLANVRFQYGLLKLHGKAQPFVLVDRTGEFTDVVA